MTHLSEFTQSTALLLVLLNPFLLTVYLLDLFQTIDARTFRRVLLRASLIAGTTFCVVALVGESLFDVLQVRYCAFLVFGGCVFLLVGLRMILTGPEALVKFRGTPEHIAGAVAMPFMIGPGTVNASILAGARMPILEAFLAIAIALLLSSVGVLLLKHLHDSVRERNAPVVERYVDIVGRVSALIVGSIAIDMILRGIELWLER